MGNRRVLSISMFVFLICGMAGCVTDLSNDTPESNSSSAYPIEQTDAIGSDFVLENEPKRIVSLIPSNTEIIYALEAGGMLVGRSDFDDYPEEVLDVQSIGGMEFDVEQIIKLEPDLILAHESGIGQAEDPLNQLNEAGYPVYVVEDAQTLDAVYDSIQSIAGLINRNEEAVQLIEEMQDELAQLSAITERSEEEQKSTWIEISPQPIYVAGKQTFIDELLQRIHALNAAEDVIGWTEVSEEAGVTYNPDVIISTYGGTEDISNRPAWQQVQAIKEDQIYDIDPNVVSRPGPRLVEGARTLAEMIYPEDFLE
ncbi:ABC transporter substrate-binding protein [Alkalicoccobacillus porphyridii]|uniref:ABC transporter substrate-binding protein n=1 Tax=Alkalicoccobacillus porphyridii TaxID=2597270 RepID=A0A553ZZJ4_9BACI|nr:ABC transporter substrate-binding protein [Alkalicoccobacillus porphyridii]TSB46868.1 ABC transporter substrate-binding protein [Alkalicoccobacillus porphyridii]